MDPLKKVPDVSDCPAYPKISQRSRPQRKNTSNKKHALVSQNFCHLKKKQANNNLKHIIKCSLARSHPHPHTCTCSWLHIKKTLNKIACTNAPARTLENLLMAPVPPHFSQQKNQRPARQHPATTQSFLHNISHGRGEMGSPTLIPPPKIYGGYLGVKVILGQK